MAHAQHSSFRPMAEVAFRPARQLSEYKGKGASASREQSPVAFDLSFTCVDNVRLQKLRWSKIKPKIEKSSIVPKLKYNFYFYEKLCLE